MTTYGAKSEFLRVMLERGFVHQCTDFEALDAALQAGRVVAYVGYDCTAPSLHVGSLVSIMMLRWLQKTGGRPIVLMGGGTTRVGDPSGKDESRKLLSDEVIRSNMASLQRVFAKYVTFGEGPSDARMVNNADWLDTLALIPFLQNFGRHFSVNQMIKRESVKLRLEREQPLTFLEFNYMVLQGYDFLELSRRHGCTLQMGGSDQWGNILEGIDLAASVDRARLLGLTCPLLTTASGAKMGKTAAGAVWLNAEERSPWEFWQYWRNTEDADVERFLKLFTDLDLHEVKKLAGLRGQEINEAKKVLATEVTALCHGRAAAEEAQRTAAQTFEKGGASAGLPTVAVPRAALEKGESIVELLKLAKLAESNTEARKLIDGGGVKVNDVTVEDAKRTVGLADLKDGAVKLSKGKKTHVLVKPS